MRRSRTRIKQRRRELNFELLLSIPFPFFPISFQLRFSSFSNHEFAFISMQFSLLLNLIMPISIPFLYSVSKKFPFNFYFISVSCLFCFYLISITFLLHFYYIAISLTLCFHSIIIVFLLRFYYSSRFCFRYSASTAILLRFHFASVVFLLSFPSIPRVNCSV